MALSVKEDSGFYLIGIATAMFLFHKNQKKHAILLTILSVAAVALSLNYIIPLNRGTSEYSLAETASKYGPTMTVAIIGMIKNFHLVLDHDCCHYRNDQKLSPGSCRSFHWIVA